MNLSDYLTTKNINRHINGNVDGLHLIYNFMTDAEKNTLKTHAETIFFNDDIRDCDAIRERYKLSKNEIIYIIKRFCCR